MSAADIANRHFTAALTDAKADDTRVVSLLDFRVTGAQLR
jgi:hypothetical protein